MSITYTVNKLTTCMWNESNVDSKTSNKIFINISYCFRGNCVTFVCLFIVCDCLPDLKRSFVSDDEGHYRNASYALNLNIYVFITITGSIPLPVEY